MAARFEIRSPKAGRYVWVLTSQGRTLATSGEYARRAMAEKAITAFRMAAVGAPVVDTTVAAAKPAPKKAARATGRALAKAVVAGAAAVEKAEKTATRATKRTAKPRQRAASRTSKG